MKKITLLSSMLGLTALLLSGCLKDQCTQTMYFYTYDPVYKSVEEVRNGIGMDTPRDLKRPGKIYFKDGYIYITEFNEGIHVINNLDPNNPTTEAFIKVPGVRDLSVIGEVMYVDSYMDLVSLDVSQAGQVAVLHREKDVFPYGSWHDGLWAEEEKGIAVDWIETEHTEEADCSNNGFGRINLPLNGFVMEDALQNGAPVLASNSNLARDGFTNTGELSTGIGGSLARMTISGQYLYVVTWGQMKVFNISNLANPNLVSEQNFGWTVETIFPKGDRLYLGTRSGMIILSLANPENPEWKSSISHVRACDPVVVEGDYAYVTVRDGQNCGSVEAVNQLYVIDVSDIERPVQVAEYDFHNPHGLGIRNGTLFICDGDEGLKIYDASDVRNITSKQLARFKQITPIDVIPLQNILLTIAEEGFYQYDYSDLNNIKQLSLIPVKPD